MKSLVNSSSPVLIVAGSRRFPASAAPWLSGRLAAASSGFSALWHGGCVSGVDLLAASWASGVGLPVRSWPAAWSSLGRAAGPVRSRSMLAAAPAGSVLLAVASAAPSAQPGTVAAVRAARSLGVPCRLAFLSPALSPLWSSLVPPALPPQPLLF